LGQTSELSIKANGYNTVSLSLPLIGDKFLGPGNLGENLGAIETDDTHTYLGKFGKTKTSLNSSAINRHHPFFFPFLSSHS
jgi:hypothetical protein